MRMTAMVVSTMVLFACGGDDDGSTPIDAAETPPDARLLDAPATACGTAGTGTISGSIGTGEGLHEVSPVVRATQFTVGSGEVTVIVLDEVGGACGTAGSNGDHFVLALCSSPAVGAHVVVDPEAFDCPSSDVVAVLESDRGGDVGLSMSGTVTITAIDGGCVTGSFDVSMVPDQGGTPVPFTGTFDALVCP